MDIWQIFSNNSSRGGVAREPERVSIVFRWVYASGSGRMSHHLWPPNHTDNLRGQLAGAAMDCILESLVIHKPKIDEHIIAF